MGIPELEVILDFDNETDYHLLCRIRFVAPCSEQALCIRLLCNRCVEHFSLQDSIVQTARSALLAPWTLVAAAEERSLPLLAVITFATEGDNVLDAEQLAGAIEHHLTDSTRAGSSPIEWQRPISWQSVYGARDLTIY